MTEQNTPSAPVEEPTTAVESSQQPAAASRKGKNTGPVLGAIAIVLVIALGAGGYYHTHKQAQQLIAANQALQQQLEGVKQSQQQERNALEGLLQQQGKTTDAADREQANLARQLSELQEKVATISGSDAKTAAGAGRFPVKMAGRKLWSDQDVTSAAALLKSADASPADMNDPSLLDVRRAITEDISTLSTLTRVDYDGIILKVNQLSNQVDNLRLADNDTDEAPMDQNSSELSSSIGEWRQNSPRAGAISWPTSSPSVAATPAPSRCWHRTGHLPARKHPFAPAGAAQAIPRHQNETYKQSLETVSTGCAPISTRPIRRPRLSRRAGQPEPTVDLDGRAGSAEKPAAAGKVMQTRVRNLMTQSPAAHREG